MRKAKLRVIILFMFYRYKHAGFNVFFSVRLSYFFNVIGRNF